MEAAVMGELIFGLRHYFRHRSDVYVIGNIYLDYEEGNPESRQLPDVMVIKGVDSTWERRTFKTWEERAVPTVIIEIASPETAEEDQVTKRLLYERLGIREYFLFDPLRDCLERPLLGYRLMGDVYEPLPPGADGGLHSTELRLRLVPEGTYLTLIHFRTGERIPTPLDLFRLLEETQARTAEAKQQVLDAQKRIVEAAQRALDAEKHASEVEQRLEQARRRRQQLEEELARLRASQPPTGHGETGAP